MVPLGAGGNAQGTPASLDERIEEHARIERLAEISGRPVTYLLHSYEHAPEEWRALLACTERANARGLEIMPQVAARGLGLLLGLDAFHIFVRRPTYLRIAHLPRAERAAAMRDPAVRQTILSEIDSPVESGSELRKYQLATYYARSLERFYVLDEKLDYEPTVDSRLDGIAARTGQKMDEVFYDVMSAGDGSRLLADFLMNYVGGGLDTVHDMLAHPDTVSGLGDVVPISL